MADVDDYKIKRLLFMQTFFPLFLLSIIRHIDFGTISLVKKFFNRLLHGDLSAIKSAIFSPELWGMIVVLFSLIWVVLTLVYMWIFKKMQTASFESLGEKIKEIEYHDDVGLNFFASYLLPLIVDIDDCQDFFVFAGMLILILIMVWRSNLYYENPALTIWKYKTFSFVTDSDVKGIGVTRGKNIDLNTIIKKKQIMDGLYFIYNEKQ